MDKIEKIKLILDSIKMPTLALPTSDSVSQGQLQSAMVAAGDAVKTKKNQRINHCIAVTDTICGASVPNTKLLANLTEVLFSLCDDPDSDIRLVASDCLNRIVRSLKDRSMHDFQLEITKEMKKGRNPRSLRAALNLFAYTCPKIRSTKCRAFAKYMASCFEDIANRDEDLLYDSLAASSAKIFENLGPFLSDEEVKNLCDTFIVNLSSESIAKRRASAGVLVSICQFSRNPNVFLPRLLQQITDLLMPNVMDKSSIIIIGGLLCIRQAIVPIYEYLKNNFQVRLISMEQQFLLCNVIKIYEMCMILCHHDDHNVITTTLELLQFMLTSPPDQVVIKIDSPMGLSASYDIERVTAGSAVREGKRLDVFENIAKLRDASLGDVGDVGKDSLFLSTTTSETDSDITDIPVFRSHTLSTSVEDVPDIDIDETIANSDRNSDIFCMANASEPEGENEETGAFKTDDEDNADSTSVAASSNVDNIPDLSIGTLFGRQRTIFYCARFLAYNFLLSGRKGQLRSDAESRISVKVLAMNCINQMVHLRPELFHLPLRIDHDEDDSKEQFIYELSLFVKHPDPMIRCGAYTLIGNAIEAILLEHNGTFGTNKDQMLGLLSTLREGLKDGSNIVVRRVIAAISCSLNELWRSPDLNEAADDLFFHLLVDFHGAYWLVKLEFVECLSFIQWDIAPQRRKLQFTVLERLLEMLQDQDARVRKTTVTSLIRFVENCGHGRSRNCGIEHTLCIHCVQNAVEKDTSNCAAFELKNDELKFWLEVVVRKIESALVEIHDKNALAGHFAALLALSQRFKPSLYQFIWKCGSGQPPMLLSVCLDYCRSSLSTDLFIHSDALQLAGNLFKGCTQLQVHQKDAIFVNCHEHLSAWGVELLHHSLSVLKLYYTATKNPNEGTAKKPPSPVSVPAIPGKKIIKSDSDKKPPQDAKFQFKFDVNHGAASAQSEKLLQIIHQNWKLYKSNLDSSVEEKFTSLLKASFETLGNTIFYINPEYPDLLHLVHDIAGITKSLCHIVPLDNFRCIRKVLQAISDDASDDVSNDKAVALQDSSIESFLKFWRQYDIRPRRPISKYASEHVLTTVVSELQSILIASLKVYTTTSDALIQAEVLSIMTEIVKGRIVYRFVDPEEQFIQIFGKQVGFLAKVPIKNSDVIVSNLFKFMVLLCGEQVQTIGDIWKCHLDIDVIIDYCKGLYRSGSPIETHCIPALRHALTYLCEPVTNDSETWYRESMKTSVLPLLLNLLPALEALPLVLKYLQGAKNVKEGPLIEESRQLISKVITSVVESKLTPRERWQHECILAMCCCCSVEAVPPVSELIGNLRKSLHTDNSNHGELQLMIMSVTYNFVLLVRNYEENEHEFPLMIVSQAWNRIWEDVDNLFPHANKKQADLTALLLKDFIQTSRALFELDNNLMKAYAPNLAHVRAEYDVWVNDWMKDVKQFIPFIMKLSCRFTFLRKELAKFLFSMECADPNQLEMCLAPKNYRKDLEKEFLTEILTYFIRNMEIPNEHGYFVHYMITSNRDVLLALASTRIGQYFLAHLDERQSKLFWKEFYFHNSRNVTLSRDNFAAEDVMDVVHVMKRLRYLSKKEIGIFCLELLERSVIPYVSLQVSHLAAKVFDEIRNDNDCKLNEHELNIVTKFLMNELNPIRFPRLTNLCRIIQNNIKDVQHWAVLRPQEVRKFEKQPLHFWCLAESQSPTEGRALGRVLTSLPFATIINYFQNSEIEISKEVISYAFREVRHLVDHGLMLATDVVILCSDNRAVLRQKFPLAVAAVDVVLAIMAKFERNMPTYVANNDGMDDDYYIKALMHVHAYDAVAVDIPNLLEGIGELFRLKAKVFEILRDNNIELGHVTEISFISPQVFTFYLYCIRALLSASTEELSVSDLQKVLVFVGDVLDDFEFMKLFNKKENVDLLISCVFSIDSIFRRIFVDCKTDLVAFSEIADPKTKKDYCVLVLHLFNQLWDFAASVEKGLICADVHMLNILVRAVSGFARFDQLNGCILMDHFMNKILDPPNPDEFPKATHVPIEVLQTDKEGLIKYVQLMKIYGIGNKTQFEENWMNLLWAINSYEDENLCQEQIVILGIRGLMMLIEQSVKVEYKTEINSQKGIKGLKQIDLVVASLEPEMNKKFKIVYPVNERDKIFRNKYHVDLKSCVRSFIELFKQWLEGSEKSPPLVIFIEVVDVLVRLSAYFDDLQDYQWVFNLFMKIYKELDRDDDSIWPHLVSGIFLSGAKLSIPEPEIAAGIGGVLDDALSSQFINVSITALKCALVFLQSNPQSTEIINRLMPHLMRNLEPLDGAISSESRLYLTWELLLFIWIYGPSGNSEYEKLEKELIVNIFSVLSPLSKTYISIRLLTLKNLKKAVECDILKPDIKVKIGRLVIDVMKTPNSAVFFDAVKLFMAIFYSDFKGSYDNSDIEPEVINQMKERCDVLFQILKSGKRFNALVASKILPHIVHDFFPPFEILNRVISEFLHPQQKSPELVAPIISQIFEKARGHQEEMTMVSEWIKSSIPNFMSNNDIPRTTWTLTFLFICISKTIKIRPLLPIAELKRSDFETKKLFVHAAIDYYTSLSCGEKDGFLKLLKKPFQNGESPYGFLLDLMGANGLNIA